METIKEITEKRNSNENLCVLAFDEMSIRKHLNYNTRLDQIDGYQDHAIQGRTSQIASHALTFMAIGLRKNWKQPIAFYFSGDSVTADRLTVLIKEVSCNLYKITSFLLNSKNVLSLTNFKKKEVTTFVSLFVSTNI